MFAKCHRVFLRSSACGKGFFFVVQYFFNDFPRSLWSSFSLFILALPISVSARFPFMLLSFLLLLLLDAFSLESLLLHDLPLIFSTFTFRVPRFSFLCPSLSFGPHLSVFRSLFSFLFSLSFALLPFYLSAIPLRWCVFKLLLTCFSFFRVLVLRLPFLNRFSRFSRFPLICFFLTVLFSLAFEIFTVDPKLRTPHSPFGGPRLTDFDRTSPSLAKHFKRA